MPASPPSPGALERMPRIAASRGTGLQDAEQEIHKGSCKLSNAGALPHPTVMSKEAMNQSGGEGLRDGAALQSYRGPWKGQLVLACRKCQKKLKRKGTAHTISSLKKALKHQARRAGGKARLKVIETPCLKLCPKGGITVCTQQQLGRGECSVLRTVADVEALYTQCEWESGNGREKITVGHADL